MEIFIKIVQLLLSLSILVILHEFGHFITARMFGTRVEKFYLFFDPWFSLFKFKRGDTEYGIGWLPLGGYVKISGMIDESMDKEQMKQPAQPWEFRSKKAWQRFIIMVAGVMMNVILAILIYIIMLAAWGEKYLPNAELKDGIAVDSLAMQTGLRTGDKIMKVDNIVIEDFFDIVPNMLLENAKTLTVVRNDTEKVLDIPSDFLKKMIDSERANMIMPRMPMIIDSIVPGSVNAASKINKGDRVIGVNGKLIHYHDEFKAEVEKYKNQEITLRVLRGTEDLTYPVKVNDKGQLEVMIVTDLNRFFNIATHDYTFWEAIPAGFSKAGTKISEYWKQLKLMFNRDVRAYENVGGFITMGKIFPGVWDWQAFWNLTAFLSLMLAVLNILPIPALDGGHVMFVLIEMITGRKPSEKVLEIAQYIGFGLLLTLLVWANLNDILKLF
ncbi:MAG: RIP metalloprotease RseP [Bacteroidetes bacterium GWF2_43_63]|nr:MAG: RIP metalloprotease RseP [Bacteroidetes bacterium GWE2_42_42]OFY53232.1 MAG: RIP metalloprotease RseP [Bacteroidetes bacterium GWF2_43_63]HBG71776.1 RIP metalloprotease RseP [Bacteroidales bacterium]HCB61559.1 RIP metalloprotease RseP [Bacteroidales bacterium]HCY22771.1 RIP metalloprotease RseP [Bacteroidales bacterium]